MAEGKTFCVPESRWDWFTSEIDLLGRRLRKLTDQSLSMMPVGKHIVDDPQDPLHGHRMVEVFMACPEVRLNGWQFVAVLAHSQQHGNVIHSLPNHELPPEYRLRASQCDHCQRKRQRRDTYVVRCDSTGQYKQVGRNCLKDFTGHRNPDQIAAIARLLANVPMLAQAARDTAERCPREISDARIHVLVDYLAAVVHTVREKGWHSAKMAQQCGVPSTASSALTLMWTGFTPTAKDRAVVDCAMAWARSFANDPNASEYQHNISVLASSACIEHRHINLAASIVGVYWKLKQPRPAVSNSHVGEVGGRIHITAVLKKVTTAEFSDRCVFEDARGNQLIWFTSNSDIRNRTGETLEIQARVKSHNTWNQRKQTVITHTRLMS